jgi:hypothetical protein
MRVLHDYDKDRLSGRWALKRGLHLIAYAVRVKLGLHDPIETETDRYLETLLMLDRLCGVESVVGLLDPVAEKKPHLKGLVEGYGADLRMHHHMGERGDPNRTRTWEPPLTQGRATWHYEEDWIAGHAGKLGAGELPVWHADYPYRVEDYIRFLYAWRFGGFDPYAGTNRGEVE